MLSACRPLSEYAWFVAQVRKNLAESKNNNVARIGDAIDKAIEDMPKDFEIREFITANRAEVKDMCLTEYNEAETMEMLKEETGWTAEKAMDTLKIPQNQRSILYVSLSKNA